jgi:sugar phosphate isomerase/epimerase
MKTVCGYTIPITKYGLPPSLDNNIKAMEEISSVGFTAMEMELIAGEQEYIDGWDSVIAKSKELDLEIVSIMSVAYELFALDTQKQEKSLTQFATICDMVREIGAGLVTACFYLPPELVPEDKKELYHGGPPSTIKVPDGFTWEVLHSIIIKQLSSCADLAAERGLDFAVELRAGDFMSSVDGLIVIFETCGKDNMGVVFDCAHIYAAKEYLEMAILKFGKYIKLVHLSDNDGTQPYHYPPGQGNIDFSAIINRLKKVGYDGDIVVDISGVENILAEAETMRKMLEDLIH